MRLLGSNVLVWAATVVYPWGKGYSNKLKQQKKKEKEAWKTKTPSLKTNKQTTATKNKQKNVNKNKQQKSHHNNNNKSEGKTDQTLSGLWTESPIRQQASLVNTSQISCQ